MHDHDHPALQVLVLLGIIERYGRTAYERHLPHDLTMSQFVVLDYFQRGGREIAPVELARAFHVTKGTMTSTLQQLGRKRFIRESPHPTDGRAKRIAITAKGRRAREDAIAQTSACLDHIAAELGPDLLRDLTTQLRIVLANLEALDPSA
jgi:DNA-binding MarR family transcriptional regulator